MFALPLLLPVALFVCETAADIGDDAPYDAHDGAQRVRRRPGVGPTESLRCKWQLQLLQVSLVVLFHVVGGCHACSIGVSIIARWLLVCLRCLCAYVRRRMEVDR